MANAKKMLSPDVSIRNYLVNEIEQLNIFYLHEPLDNKIFDDVLHAYRMPFKQVF